MKKQTIQIACEDGSFAETEAYVFGPIAVHTFGRFGRNHWALTHRGSGMATAHVHGPGWAAQTLAREFRDASVPWDDQDKLLDQDNWPRIVEQLTEAWERAVHKIEKRGTHRIAASSTVPFAHTYVRPVKITR